MKNDIINISGSLSKKGKYYYTIVQIPQADGTKKPRWEKTGICVYGPTGKVSAENKRIANDLLVERRRAAMEEVCNKDNTLFIDACEAWVASYKKAESTKDAYALTCKAHLRPYFEPLKLRLSDITHETLQAYIDYKTDSSAEHPLKGKTVKKHIAVMIGVLKAAKRAGIVQSVFWDDLEYPEDEAFEGTVYTKKELQTFLNASRGSPIYNVIVLIALLGLRRSEALGLCWSMIDLEKGTARIRDTVVYVTKTIHKQKPKNSSSDRTLSLSSNTVQYLKILKTKQEVDKSLYGDTYYDNDFVCKHEDGRPINTRYFNAHFNKILEQHHLRMLRPHDLRHTAASLLIDADVNVKVIQEFLGHSSSITTLDIYAHAFKAREKAAAENLGMAFTI